MKIHKGDTVSIITGKDKGKKGKVEKVDEKNKTVLVPDTNMYKRHVRKSEQFPQGGIIDLPRSLDVAKVALVCPKCSKITRVGYRTIDGIKKRVCRKCDAVVT